MLQSKELLTKMKTSKMLWLSRHYLTIEQRDDLERIFGPNLTITHSTKQVTSGEDVFHLAKDSDLLGIVLPIHIINEIFQIKRDNHWMIRVLYSIAGRHETGRKIINPANNLIEKEYLFSHIYWQEILDTDIKMRRL